MAKITLCILLLSNLGILAVTYRQNETIIQQRALIISMASIPACLGIPPVLVPPVVPAPKPKHKVWPKARLEVTPKYAYRAVMQFKGNPTIDTI